MNAVPGSLSHSTHVVLFPLPLDKELYKWRHLIENFFCKLKEFKRIAMRADKTDQSFAAFIHLAAAVINSRSNLNKPYSDVVEEADKIVAMKAVS